MSLLHRNAFQNNTFTALLCVTPPELQETCGSQLAQLGFETHASTNPEDAISQLYSRTHDVVVVAEKFGGADLETHPILAELALVALDVRRAMYVVLIGPSCVTQSEMQAFCLSVDLVINLSEVFNLKMLVGKGIARHEEFYAAFQAETLSLHKEG